MSTNVFDEKTIKYASQVRQLVEKGDFDGAVRTTNQAIAYIEGVMTSEKNPNTIYDYVNYLSSMELSVGDFLWILWSFNYNDR